MFGVNSLKDQWKLGQDKLPEGRVCVLRDVLRDLYPNTYTH